MLESGDEAALSAFLLIRPSPHCKNFIDKMNATHRIFRALLKSGLRSAPRFAAPALGAAGLGLAVAAFTLGGRCAEAAPAPLRVAGIPDDVPLPRHIVDLPTTTRYMDDLRADSTRSDRVLVALRIGRYLAERFPEEPEVLWRAARAYYDVAREQPGLIKTEIGASSTPQTVFQTALKLLRDAQTLPAGRNNNHVYRWSGIVLNEAGKFAGTKEYIQNAFVIRDDWKTAVAIDPYDATARHLLGRWCFDVAGMSWVVRKVAATLFAEPPNASYDEALQCFQGAEDVQPGFWVANQYYLGATCEKLGDKEGAKRWYASALVLPVSTAEDRSSHESAMKALEKLDAGAAAAIKKQLAVASGGSKA